MAKNSIRDYSATNSSNTDIQSIDISEGCSPAGINNAIREVMADLKDVSTGAVALESPSADSLTVTGDLTVDTSTLKVDSTNNRVGIANASPSVELDVTGAAKVSGDLTVDTNTLYVDSTNNRVGIGTSSPSSNAIVKFLEIEDATSAGLVLDGPRTYSIYSSASSTLAFRDETASANRMLIDSSGNLLVSKTSSGLSTVGHELGSSGYVYHTRDNATPFYINRLTSDGSLAVFYQDTALEGSISVSGTTVSYNGGHLARWSQLTDGTKDTNIVKGTVMTNLDQMAVWHHEAVAATYYVEGDELPEITPATYYTEEDTLPEGISVGDEKTAAVYAQVGDEKTPAADAYTEDNEQLNCMAVSSVEGDADVAGVFVSWDNEDDFNDMNIAMTGDMVIRIAQGTTVQRGDLLMSAGDGTAKPQGDDIVRSKTIAKVTSTHVSHTYDDGSYLVPCVLMAC